MSRVAINGFGRIGRAFFKAAFLHPDIEIVAINDLGSTENLAYLLKYDSVYGTASFDVQAEEGQLIVDKKKIRVCAEKDPAQLPAQDMHNHI